MADALGDTGSTQNLRFGAYLLDLASRQLLCDGVSVAVPAPRVRPAGVPGAERPPGGGQGRAAGRGLAGKGDHRGSADPGDHEGAQGRGGRRESPGRDQDRARARLPFRGRGRGGTGGRGACRAPRRGGAGLALAGTRTPTSEARLPPSNRTTHHRIRAPPTSRRGAACAGCWRRSRWCCWPLSCGVCCRRLKPGNPAPSPDRRRGPRVADGPGCISPSPCCLSPIAPTWPRISSSLTGSRTIC